MSRKSGLTGIITASMLALALLGLFGVSQVAGAAETTNASESSFTTTLAVDTPSVSRLTISNEFGTSVATANGNLAISDEFGGTTTPAVGEGTFTTSSSTPPVVGENSFTTTVNTVTTTNGGGSSSSGGGGSSGSSGGQVLGAQLVVPPPGPCPIYLHQFIHIGRSNNQFEVRRLQAFLDVFEGEHLPITGFYSQADFAAVSRFQQKYLADVLHPWGIEHPTGYVFITTRLAINNVFCHRSTANDLNLRNYYGAISGPVVQASSTSALASTPVATTSVSVVTRPNLFQTAATGLLKLFNLYPARTFFTLLLLAILFLAFLIWRLGKYPDPTPPPEDGAEISTSDGPADGEVLIEDVAADDQNDLDPGQPALDSLD